MSTFEKMCFVNWRFRSFVQYMFESGVITWKEFTDFKSSQYSDDVLGMPQ